jgi:kynurenine 3-monooxygenase
MIALPNHDGSFTCTLFLAKKGEQSFEQLGSETAVLGFFESEFPDALGLMPSLIEDFFQNPTGDLGTLECWPWHLDGKVLLLGDAAHAMVPFYGQGMNCAFEDVRVLDTLLADHENDWERVFCEFSAKRKPNADAIQEMAEENFYEMRDRVADPVFQRKRQLETKLEQNYPEYFSKYSMVTFREDLPYSEAKAKGNAQDAFLMAFCGNVETVDGVDLDELITRMDKEITV